MRDCVIRFNNYSRAFECLYSNKAKNEIFMMFAENNRSNPTFAVNVSLFMRIGDYLYKNSG